MKENYIENNESEPIIDIEFNQHKPEELQKFITAETSDGRKIIASYPGLRFHEDILKQLRDKSGDSNITCTGGGLIFQKNNNSGIDVCGSSTMFGPFNIGFVLSSLQKNYPDRTVEFNYMVG